MAVQVECRCNACGHIFKDLAGDLIKSQEFRCEKCGKKQYVANEHIESFSQICPACGGTMSKELSPMCPRCNNKDVSTKSTGVFVD